MQYLNKSLFSIIAVAFLYGCSEEPKAPAVSFKTDVKPVIDSNCTECHNDGGAGTLASGFKTTDYHALMKGTKFGPVIVPGQPLSSSFYRLIAGKVDPSIQMPHGKEAIPDAQIAMIENWIEQGATNN
jgi:hypothetical protein